MKLTDPITSVKGVGDKTAALYHKLNIYTVYDLITHYPREYEEWQDITSVSDIQVNQVQAIHATVISVPQTLHVKRNMSITTVHVKDSTGQCDLAYFNMPYIKNNLQPGKQYILRGQAVMRRNVLTLEHPKIITGEEFIKHLHTLTPIYSTTKGLTVQAIAKTVRNALDELAFYDYFPDFMRTEYDLPEYAQAMRDIHFPENRTALIAAVKGLYLKNFSSLSFLL